jgi:hypothetical protein
MNQGLFGRHSLNRVSRNGNYNGSSALLLKEIILKLISETTSGNIFIIDELQELSTNLMRP